MFHPDKFASICTIILVLNTCLLPYISDTFVFQEFLSNNLVFIGVYLISYVSKKFDYLTYPSPSSSPWFLSKLLWIVIVSKLTSPDSMNLQNYIIIYLKTQIINLLCLILGLCCLYIIIRSVYYDGILFIWTFFAGVNYKQTNVIDV